MSNALLNVVANVTATEGEDVLFTAIEDFRSTVSGLSVDPHVVMATVDAMVLGFELLPREAWPELVVKAMGVVQGLCPRDTWERWQRLNGC